MNSIYIYIYRFTSFHNERGRDSIYFVLLSRDILIDRMYPLRGQSMFRRSSRHSTSCMKTTFFRGPSRSLAKTPRRLTVFWNMVQDVDFAHFIKGRVRSISNSSKTWFGLSKVAGEGARAFCHDGRFDGTKKCITGILNRF